MVNNNKNFHQDIIQFFDGLSFYKKDDATIAPLFPAMTDELQPCSIQEIKNIYSKFQQNISQETANVKNKAIELRETMLFLKEKVEKEQLVVDHPEKSHLAHCDPETLQGYIGHYIARLPERKRELQQLQNELKDLETQLESREFDDHQISLLCDSRINDISAVSDIEARCQKEINRLQNEITTMNAVIEHPEQSDLKDLPPQDLQRFLISYPASIQKRKTQVATLEKEIIESKKDFFNRVQKFEHHDIYHRASTRKTIETLNSKILEIENAISTALAENDTLLDILKTIAPNQRIQAKQTIDNNKQKIAEWTTNYTSVVTEKLALVKRLPNKTNPVVEMSIPSVTKKGTHLYHCTKNSAIMDSILANGPRNQTLLDADKDEVGNFKTPCLGNGGIYTSTNGPSYLSDGYNCIMVFEVVNDIAETATIPCDQLQLQFVQPGHISKDEYLTGFVQLQQDAKLLRNSGASANTSERVIRNPDKKIRVVGVIENFRGEARDFKNSAITPIHKYLETRQNIQLHDSWARSDTIELVENRHDSFVLRINGTLAFFKKGKGATKELLDLGITAEIAGSHFANGLIGNLVPKATEMTYNRDRGIRQPLYVFKPLKDVALKPSGEFDATRLLKKQQEQLFAHLLTDWVISNHDTHIGQFGILDNGDLISYDKGQAYKYFCGPQVKSKSALQGIGAEVNVIGNKPSFFNLNLASDLIIYEKFLEDIRRGKIVIDRHSPIIKKVIDNAKNLTAHSIPDLKAYANHAFPGQEDLFIKEAIQRAHELPAQVDLFLDKVGNIIRYHKAADIPQAQSGLSFHSLRNVIGAIADQHQANNPRIDNYFKAARDVAINEPKTQITQQFNTLGHFGNDGFFREWKSGIILRESDGRIWLRKVANNFAGYEYSFPKGTLEAGFSLQQNALKELYEETGMTGVIEDFLCDNQKPGSTERYYVARRTAGTPTEAGWETDHMVLASPKEALALLNVEADKQVCRQFIEKY